MKLTEQEIRELRMSFSSLASIGARGSAME